MEQEVASLRLIRLAIGNESVDWLSSRADTTEDNPAVNNVQHFLSWLQAIITFGQNQTKKRTAGDTLSYDCD